MNTASTVHGLQLSLNSYILSRVGPTVVENIVSLNPFSRLNSKVVVYVIQSIWNEWLYKPVCSEFIHVEQYSSPNTQTNLFFLDSISCIVDSIFCILAMTCALFKHTHTVVHTHAHIRYILVPKPDHTVVPQQHGVRRVRLS